VVTCKGAVRNDEDLLALRHFVALINRADIEAGTRGLIRISTIPTDRS